jgi:hypothetical protein
MKGSRKGRTKWKEAGTTRGNARSGIFSFVFCGGRRRVREGEGGHGGCSGDRARRLGE